MQESILDPALPIIDPHHHLWHDRPSGRYMPEQLAADLASGHNVVATVFVQCGWMHRTTAPGVPPSSTRVAEDWRPFVEPCIEWFGAERCIFESNFPVDKGMVSYPELWNAFRRLAANASAIEKAALFYNTARSFYRLDLD